MKSSLFMSAAAFVLAIASPVFAQNAAAPTAQSEEITEVVILGRGQARQTQTLRQADLDNLTPGSSVLKSLAKLPGVSFQSADPFGTYEWSTRLSVRGFAQQQMGFTLDGVTLGDMSYGNYNGMHISRAIINEDLARAEMAQGAGSLDAATSSNLGGTLKFSSRTVSDKFGGQLNLTAGSNDTARIYGRIDSGAIDALGGLRGYVSVADHKAEKWKGAGKQKSFQVNSKAELPIEDGVFTAIVNHSQRREQDYQDMSFEMIKRLGRDWDNFQPNWALATQVATAYLTSKPLPAGIGSVDDAYYYGAGVRDDTLSMVKYDGKILGALDASVTLYKHDNDGQGLWATPYVPSPNFGNLTATSDNAPISIRTTEYDIVRTGLIANFGFNAGNHAIKFGLWAENNDFQQARRFYAENLAAPKRDSLGFQANPFFTQWYYDFNTKTTQAFVQDTWTVSEALKVNFGFKALQTTNTVENLHNPAIPGTRAALKAELKSEDNFLPQAGVVYKLSDSLEVFGSYTENMQAFVSAASGGPFSSGNQAQVDYIENNLKPESSKTIETGLRFNSEKFSGVVALYNVDFDGRIVAVSQGAGIVGNAAVLSNVGSVETRGIELVGTYRLDAAWKLYCAASFNSSEYANDYYDASSAKLIKTGGKTVVNTPKVLATVDLSYDKGNYFGNLIANHVGERYYTYENIGGKVDGYTVLDFNMGYRINKSLELQVNISNFLNEDYISTIGSNGYNISDASNSSQTILTSAPRQLFVTVRKSF